MTTQLEHGDFELSELYDALRSKEYRVVDESGVNVANATIRHFYGDSWLYQDDTDGFRLLDETEVADLYLTDMNAPKFGWDTQGNVIEV